MFTNDKTVKVKVKDIYIGGGAPVTVQSMLSVPSTDIKGNVQQAKRLKAAGCDIIRVAIPDMAAVSLISAIKNELDIPLVADIHFDYKLALESVAAGIDKIRINPGNIGDESRVKQVANACKRAGVPIRIGVNSGSLERDILARFGAPTPEALVESGLYHISLLTKYDFNDIVLSLKSSNTKTMFDAYTLAALKCPYPLHLGVTEAGTSHMGVIKSAAGIGGLLLSGIGSTIRVSLTDEPEREVYAGIDLLKAIGLRNDGIHFVSCPTCGRTRVNLIGLAKEAEERFKNVKKNITVAIMGCVVNGPGEAREADLGIACGEKCGVIFKKGKVISEKIPEERLIEELSKEIEKY